jgi:hypothetical protein
MNSDDYNRMPHELPEAFKKLKEEFDAREVTPEQLIKEGVDKITYFERRRDALREQTKK